MIRLKDIGYQDTTPSIVWPLCHIYVVFLLRYFPSSFKYHILKSLTEPDLLSVEPSYRHEMWKLNQNTMIFFQVNTLDTVCSFCLDSIRWIDYDLRDETAYCNTSILKIITSQSSSAKFCKTAEPRFNHLHLVWCETENFRDLIMLHLIVFQAKRVSVFNCFAVFYM